MHALFLFLSLWASTGAPGSLPEKWRRDYVPFSVPWVDSLGRDARVVAVAAKWYPTIVSVRFLPLGRDADKNVENLWVRILDRDSASGLYLGEVVEKPVWLVSVAKHDNVVFRFGTILENRPTALPQGFSYLALPENSTKFDEALAAGVAASREVEDRGDQASLSDCTAKLRRAFARADSSTPRRGAFHAALLLGQCFADGHQLDSAVNWYRMATRIDSSDLDGAMSLLGQYSLRYSEAYLDRNRRVGVATKAAMQKLADWIRLRDTSDRKLGRMVDAIYACADPVRAKRKDPCNRLLYRR